jgi:hypothetical protein
MAATTFVSGAEIAVPFVSCWLNATGLSPATSELGDSRHGIGFGIGHGKVEH